MPTIDLHGENRVTARLKVIEFINDNFKLGNMELAIVHGVGEGILKKEVHEVLKKNKKVLEFGIDYFNLGCTLVKLDINFNTK